MENDEIDFNETADEKIGSDELLADDDLRLPDNANIMVRLHAVRAWLGRRRNEAAIEVGEAALAMQQEMEVDAINRDGSGRDKSSPYSPHRRLHRERQELEAGLSSSTRLGRSQKALSRVREAQEQLSAFEEAQVLLEECIAHTSGERALVEYYLTLEQLLLDNGYSFQAGAMNLAPTQHSPWYDAMAEVLHRIEHVGTPQEE